ncbi:MAG TPA: hypothetical protein VK563_09875 [Puia sp.]|nr:hypothetical protein [Puia sp.]
MNSTFTNTDKKTTTIVNKTLITFMTLVLVVATGLLSYSLFRHEEYNVSSLLTITSYLSIVLGIYVVSTKKRIAHR